MGQIGIRLNDKTEAILRQQAEANGVKLSTYIKNILENKAEIPQINQSQEQKIDITEISEKLEKILKNISVFQQNQTIYSKAILKSAITNEQFNLVNLQLQADIDEENNKPKEKDYVYEPINTDMIILSAKEEAEQEFNKMFER